MFRRLVVSFALFAVAGIAPGAPFAPSAALASCGSESCPLDHASRWDDSRLSFEITQQYIDQDQPRVGTSDASVGAIPAHHDEVRTVNRITTARATYRPAGAWSFGVALPFVDRTHEHIHNHHGAALYQRWNYEGLGDLEATVGRQFGSGAESGTRFFVSAGVKAPTGDTSVEEVDGDQPEPSALPGTGSWDALVGMGVERRLRGPGFAAGDVPLRLSVNGRLNGRGTERYRVGAELAAHAWAELPLHRSAALLLQTNFRLRAKDDVGTYGAEEGNTGGTAAYVTPGFKISPGSRTSFYGLLQLPVYQRVNGIQVVSGSNLYFGVTRAIL